MKIARTACLAAALAGLAAQALAFNPQPDPPARFAWQAVDFPVAIPNVASGINDAGDIVGNFVSAQGIAQTAFLRRADGSVMPLQVTDSTLTLAMGINNQSTVVGAFSRSGGSHGFINDAQGTRSLDPPGYGIVAHGINDAGQVVGESRVLGDPLTHGWLMDASGFHNFDHPGQDVSTTPHGIGSRGAVVGYSSVLGSNQAQAFLYDGTTFNDFVVPGATSTFFLGMNNEGWIVGTWEEGGTRQHGLLIHDGVWTTLDIPGSPNTWLTGVNNLGQIVGNYDDPGSAGLRSFTATLVPEPPTAVLALLGAGALWLRRRRASGGALALLLGLGAATGPALAFNPQPDPPAKLNWQSIDIPGAVETFANGVNSKGVVAGYSDDGITLAHGFTLAGNALTSYDAPGAVRITEHYGINNAGSLSGAYYDGTRLAGYLLQGNAFTPLVPAGGYTVAWGLNDSNKVVGSYDASGADHGFSWNGASFTDLLVPGSVSTQARDIDNFGRIVGWSVDGAGFLHGFELVGGNYTVFDVPGDLSYATRIMGTNDHNWVVGSYGDDTGKHGFARGGNTTWRIDIPGAKWTEVRGISDQLVMVGAWGDADGVTVHGFTATIAAVPEPQTWALFGAGALLLALRRRSRRRSPLAPLALLASLATPAAHAASDHWVQAFVDARGNGTTLQQDSGQIDGPVASAGPLGFSVVDANGSFNSNISGNAAYGHLWGQASADQNSPNFARQSDANADAVAFQDRLTLNSANLAPGTFVPFSVTMVVTDKLSAAPATCCSNVAVNGRYDFSGMNFGDQAGPGKLLIDHQVTQVFNLLWAVGAAHDIGAILFYDVGSSPGVNGISGGSRVDLADVTFTFSLPSGVNVVAASGHDYTAAVPEPASALLMALGLAGLMAARRARPAPGRGPAG